jgi:hypothetical protein
MTVYGFKLVRSSGREILGVPYFPGISRYRGSKVKAWDWDWDLICGTAGSFSHKNLTILIYSLGLTLESVKKLEFLMSQNNFSLRKNFSPHYSLMKQNSFEIIVKTTLQSIATLSSLQFY